jgi:hypothetical protein
MTLIEEIRSSWGWTGLVAVEVVGQNDFGNLIVLDAEGFYWRICPEELDCQIIASGRAHLDELSINQEFLRDWYMASIAQMAKAKFGELSNDRKYCLKVPGVLGGKYDESNIATISLTELIRASGYLALQIKNLPDGAQVKLSIVD